MRRRTLVVTMLATAMTLTVLMPASASENSALVHEYTDYRASAVWGGYDTGADEYVVIYVTKYDRGTIYDETVIELRTGFREDGYNYWCDGRAGSRGDPGVYADFSQTGVTVGADLNLWCYTPDGYEARVTRVDVSIDARGRREITVEADSYVDDAIGERIVRISKETLASAAGASLAWGNPLGVEEPDFQYGHVEWDHTRWVSPTGEA